MRIGDICESRVWLSINKRPLVLSRWCLGFGPTYNGTIAGIVLATPWFVVIGHVRKLG